VTSKSRLLYEDLGPENDDHSRVGEDQPEIILVATHSPIYGVTTGFGDSVGFHMGPKKAIVLQRNIIAYISKALARLRRQTLFRT
jgi:histidine ammonia-lyase